MIGEYLLFALTGAIVIDLFFGEPSNRLHPVAWIGKLIEFFIPKLKEHDDNSTKKEKERENGIIFSIFLIITFGLAIHFLTFISFHVLGSVAMIIVSALNLTITIAIRRMEDYAEAVIDALERHDMHDARHNLSMIVRRETKNLDEKHVLSGTIECISESTVDGIVSPFFYYSFFVPECEFIYIFINNIDYMFF
jgi:adenosylcobinamide-phosphate synthase